MSAMEQDEAAISCEASQEVAASSTHNAGTSSAADLPAVASVVSPPPLLPPTSPGPQQELEQPGGRSVMAASGLKPSVSVQLHPLVVLNVAEHWTRVRAQHGGQAQPVIGALVGQQKGWLVELVNSFELLFDTIDGQHVIDTSYYALKEAQFKQVFESADLVGWYTTGGAPDHADVAVHKQVCKLSEGALMLKLNPEPSGAQLPVTVYESVIDLVDGEAQMLMLETGYQLASDEAERIGVDHVARASTTTAAGGGETADSSQLTEVLVPQHGAISMLHSRVRIVLRYLQAMRSGQVPFNHEIAREAVCVSRLLPLARNSAGFSRNLATQMNDAVLTTYLAALTKGCNSTLQYINRFNTLYDKQGVGRRVRGMFF